jgi:hypothetical protein
MDKWSASVDRNVLGTKNLGDILSERESIALEMQVRSLFQMYDFSLHVPPPTSYTV